MIFEALNQAADDGELILLQGGLCHFHKRQDGVVTIREIIVLPANRRYGIGSTLVTKARGDACKVVARCPADLPSNAFWEAMGFVHTETQTTRTGRSINVWVWDAPCG